MTPSRSPMLQDDQKFALMKFRRSVSDLLRPEHDDFYLVRWLNARNWNAENAEKMLRDSFKWRERWGADDIVNWDEPRALRDFTPHGLSGFDKEGSPIIVVPFAGMDMYGMLHAVSRADFIRSTLKNIESYMDIAYEQSKKHGPKARQFVILFDLEGFNVKQYAWRPAGEVVISLIKSYETNYPEILKCCYLINVPKVFVFAFNIVRRFLDEYTISKIFMFNSKSKKWLPELLAIMDESQLPKYFGGTMTDDDGNEKCLQKINWGGTVPRELYTLKTDQSNRNEDLIEATIKNGDKIQLLFKCEEAGSLLKWDFRTYEHDIRFGVKKTNDKSGEETIEIELRRVAAHQLDEEGFIMCQPECTYSVVFDNTYSFFKNKRIQYSVLMVSPVNIDEDDECLNQLTTAVA